MICQEIERILYDYFSDNCQLNVQSTLEVSKKNANNVLICIFNALVKFIGMLQACLKHPLNDISIMLFCNHNEIHHDEKI